jgi:hypothetical protein
MDAEIHNILQKTGIAKGMKPEEVLQLMVLGNDELLRRAKKVLVLATKKGKITQNELKTFLGVLDECSQKYRKVSNNMYKAIKTKEEELIEEYAREEIEKKEKETLELQKTKQILINFLSQQS